MMRRGILFPVLLLAGLAAVFPASAQDPLIHPAELQFDAGHYSAAIGTLQSVLKQSPQNPLVYYWLGRCYYELRDYDRAIAQLESAAKFDPASSAAHDWLGRAFGGKAEREHSFFTARKVKHEFEEAIRLDPRNIQARRDLMEYEIEAPWIVGGNKDSAKEHVDAIAAVDPVEGHLARADYWRELKKPESAETEYRWILAAKPNRLEPYLEVAGFYERQKNPSALDAAVDAGMKVNASDPRLAYFRGVARVMAGNELPQAEQYLKSYLASSPERSDWPSHAAAREWLGKLYESEGKLLEAAEQYRAALQSDPRRKEAKERLEHLEKGNH